MWFIMLIYPYRALLVHQQGKIIRHYNKAGKVLFLHAVYGMWHRCSDPKAITLTENGPIWTLMAFDVPVHRIIGREKSLKGSRVQRTQFREGHLV